MRPIRTALLAYVAAFVAVLGLQVLGVSLLVTGGDPADPGRIDPVRALLTGVPLSSAALILIALASAGSPRRQRLGLVAGRAQGRVVLVMIAGMLALSQALESLSVVVGLGPGPTLDWLNRSLAGASGRALVLAVLVVGLLAPVAEELFFRGFMLGRLREQWPPGRAIVVTSLGFGLIHGEPVHAALAFAIGIYLGWVAERSASVAPAIGCHAVNNTVSVLLVASAGARHGVGWHLLLLAVAVPVFALSLWAFRVVPRAA